MNDETLSEDWIKTLRWDLPTNLSGLIWAIGAANKSTDDQAEDLRHLMTLPAWQAAPTVLCRQVEALVDATPTKRASLGRRVRRWATRDWAEWDAEHPYEAHPRELDTSGLTGKENPDAPITKEEASANLQGYMDRAKSEPTFEADRDWYSTRNEQVSGWAKAAGVDVPTYVGALAATSPLCPWESKNGIMMNKNLADKAIAMAQANPDVDPKEFAKSLDAPGMLKSSLSNAMTVVQGNTEQALSGPKVRSFFNNIVNPQGNDVTMDTWMARALAGKPDLQDEKQLKQLVGGGSMSKPNQAKYSWGADLVRGIATKEGMTPNQAQAVIWTQVKRETTLRGAV